MNPNWRPALTAALLGMSAIVADPAVAQPAQAAVAPPDAEPTADTMRQARAAAAAKRYDEAVALYGQVLAGNPSHVDARLARGRTLAWAKRWNEAEADLTAVTTASPAYADAWAALGDLYLWSDRPAEAVAAYDRWQLLEPDRHEPYAARARAHRAAGSTEAARRDVEEAVARGAPAPVPGPGDGTDGMARRASSDELAGTGFRWGAQVDVRHTGFSGGRDNWLDYTGSIRRRFERGSVALELLHADRFGQTDNAVAIDAYVDTWHRAYANLRYQNAGSGGLLPDAWRAEIYQGVGQGWEVSAGVDHLRFPSSSVDIYSLGVGKYAGNFFIRARTRYVPSSGSRSHQVAVRYYYAGNGDDYLEGSAGTGRGEEEFRGFVVDDDSHTLAVSYVRYVRPGLGFKLGARHVDGLVDERQLTAGLLLRW